MNTTKLHVIAQALRKEMTRTDAVNMLDKIQSALQSNISQPQSPNHQQKLSEHLNNLYSKLDESPVNDYSPAWRDSMEELGVIDEFGSMLERKLRLTFERNQITAQTALEEVKKMHEELSGTFENLVAMIKSFEYFGIGEDHLEQDECEVGIVIPRGYVKDNMKLFGKELVDLEKALLVFSELATGEREPLHIRQISSSELSIFLEYVPQIGACIAVAVERLVALYKNVLEIKKLHREAADRKVPETVLKGLEDHAASMVSPEISKLASELVEQYGGSLDESRRNEIQTELRHSLNKLANRIDRGFNIELRVAPPDSSQNGEESDSGEAQAEANRQIMQSAARIEYLEHAEEPVLFLPEADEKSDE